MKKLYEKNELSFALLWIAVYVAGTSLAETLNEMLGTFKLVSAVFHIGMTAGLFLWVKRNWLENTASCFPGTGLRKPGFLYR